MALGPRALILHRTALRTEGRNCHLLLGQNFLHPAIAWPEGKRSLGCRGSALRPLLAHTHGEQCGSSSEGPTSSALPVPPAPSLEHFRLQVRTVCPPDGCLLSPLPALTAIFLLLSPREAGSGAGHAGRAPGQVRGGAGQLRGKLPPAALWALFQWSPGARQLFC